MLLIATCHLFYPGCSYQHTMIEASDIFMLGLAISYIYYRCAPNITVPTLWAALPEHCSEWIIFGIVSYTYEYQSQSNHKTTPCLIGIHYNTAGLAGSCICPS